MSYFHSKHITRDLSSRSLGEIIKEYSIALTVIAGFMTALYYGTMATLSWINDAGNQKTTLERKIDEYNSSFKKALAENL